MSPKPLAALLPLAVLVFPFLGAAASSNEVELPRGLEIEASKLSVEGAGGTETNVNRSSNVPAHFFDDPAVETEAAASPASKTDLVRFWLTQLTSPKQAAMPAGEYQHLLGLEYSRYGAHATARWFFARAAEAGNVDSELELGRCFYAGVGGPTNLVEAYKWLDVADRLGCWAHLYETGTGVTNEAALMKAMISPQLAPEQSAAAQRSATQFLAAMSESVIVSAASYVEAIAMGPELGGDCRRALSLRLEAARRGSAGAWFFLASMYKRGCGGKTNANEAAKWFRKAAEAGLSGAQLQIGLMYANGEGVPKDYVEGYKWLNLAAANGDAQASRQRNSLSIWMSAGQLAEAQRQSSAFVPTRQASEEVESSRPQPQELGVQAPKATGSGFFASEDGFFLTSYHVITGAQRIVLRTKQGNFPARVIAADRANDLALIKASGHFSALPIIPSSGVRLGDAVFTIGFPNIDVQGFAAKLTKGEISSLAGVQDDPREFQISVAVQPGNSGGPLINEYGNVVGVIESRLADAATFASTGLLPQNVSYAIKGSIVRALLEGPDALTMPKEANPGKDRSFREVAGHAEEAVALVLVY